MPDVQRPVFLVTARDATVRYLDNPMRRRELQERLVSGGDTIYAAYAQSIREACPDLPDAFYLDVVDMVRAAILAAGPKMIRPARRVVA